MALEAFSNSLTRAAGIVTSYSGVTIGAGSTELPLSASTGIGVSDLVDNQFFLAGTKVRQIDGATVYTDTASTNQATTTAQTVRFLGPTTAYTSPSATKSILIGGTFANNTNNSVNLTVEIYDQSTGISAAIASKIPVPSGSSFVVSDIGKTLLESQDELRIYSDTTNAIDANISILTGVN